MIFFSRLKNVFENDMQIAAILSRPQRVKSFISSRTLLSRLIKRMEGRALWAGYHLCVPDISIDLVA